jgi:AmmeMemoRadiSam system protein B
MRYPAAIGFYPGNKEELVSLLKKFVIKDEKIDAKAAIVPHAGYIYSGSVAGAVYSKIKTEKKIFLIAGPNHTGIGKKIAISQEDWLTPLGVVKTKRFDELEKDEYAHIYEHSIEVHLPFLQYLFKNFEILPICLSYLSFKKIEELAERLVDEEFFYIASSDFTHYGLMYDYELFSGTQKEILEEVRKIDIKAIKFIEKLEAKKFYNFVLENSLTICGFVPITLILLIAKKIGAEKGFLIKYSTSYEITKNSSFVTYAGIIIV